METGTQHILFARLKWARISNAIACFSEYAARRTKRFRYAKTHTCEMSATRPPRRALLHYIFPALAIVAAVAAVPKPIVIDPAYEHDKWQTRPKDIERKFEAYTVSFDGRDDNNGDGTPDLWRVPEWVAYEIKRYDGVVPKYQRPAWFTDKGLFAEQIAPSDRSYAGIARLHFDRGHMCMKNHASRISASADRNTHTLLNVVPQAALLNERIWLDLEGKTADWADTYGRVWIVCGPIFNNKTPANWIGGKSELKVAVPDYCYKIVVRESETPGKPHVLAFRYPNTNSERVLPKKGPFDQSKFEVTVDDIEAATGLDFLTVLDNAVENKIESQLGPIWP